MRCRDCKYFELHEELRMRGGLGFCMYHERKQMSGWNQEEAEGVWL